MMWDFEYIPLKSFFTTMRISILKNVGCDWEPAKTGPGK
jgi:hypothetical protein